MLNEIEIIEGLQKRRNLNDDDFAESIGIHRVSWLRIKRTGKIGAETKEKLINAFPELRDVFFPSNATPCKQTDYNSVQLLPHPLPLRARISRRLYRLLDKLLRKIIERLIIEPDGRED